LAHPPKIDEQSQMNPEDALKFVKSHGVVLASAKGPVPRMSEVFAGESIRGSWWGHPKGGEIYVALGALQESPDVLVCRVVGGMVTFVHRRLWPALICAAHRFPPEHLARIEQFHTPSGRQANYRTPFPLWADSDSIERSRALSEDEALDALGDWAK